MTKTSTLIERLDTASDRAAEKVIRQFTAKDTPALLRAAADRDRPRVRKWALQALGAVGDRRAAPVLVAALADERMTVRLHALRGLGRLQLASTARAVAKLVRDDSGGVRVNAVQSLIAIGNAADARRAIFHALKDPKWYVRQQAVIGCGELGYTGARARLSRLAQADPRKAVREAAKGTIFLLVSQVR